MKRGRRVGLTGIAVLAGLAVLVCGSALAYFTTTGVGNASAGVSTLTAPTITAATPGVGGTVALSWGAVTAPGSGTVNYSVSRDGGEANGTCPGKGAPAPVLTCTDSNLKPGTYSYVVTATWRSWTSTSSTSNANVTVGPADHLVLSAASSTPTAGAADNLTITAKDSAGNTVTTYTGSHNLVFSGAGASPSGTKPTVASSAGTATNFGSATAINFTAGVATVTASKNGVMKLYASGETGVGVSDGTISTESPLEVTVAAAATSKFALTALTSTPMAGAEDNLTIVAQDTYGNSAMSYTGSHSLTFTGASASPDGTAATVSDSAGTPVAFGTALPISFSAGTAAASGTKNGVMRLYKSGSTTVKVSDGTFSTTLVVTVSPEDAAEFTLAASTTTPVEGAADNLTITALDPYGNTDSTYAGAQNLVFSGSSASPNGTLPTIVNSTGSAINFGSATAISFTAGVAKVASSKNGVMKLYRAGAASISVSDGTISNPTPLAVTVSAGSASRWALTNITISAGSLGSTCLFTCTLAGLGSTGTVKAKVNVTDSVGNTVSALGNGHAAKVTTSGSGTISGTPLAMPSSGAAESATTFSFTSKSSSSETLTVAAAEGTAYTTATLTAGK